MTLNLYKKLSYALFSVLVIFILLTFKQYGISNDEQVQHVYGQLLLKLYSSGFTDQSAFMYKNLYLYGGFFDLIAAFLEKILPLWVWDIRHLLSAAFGLAGMIAVYKSTRELSGERAALFAVLLLTITGAWTGAMFTHTKDVSFGACMAWALYYMIIISRHLPHIPLKLALKFGAAVGFALGLRIGGAFAVIYIILLVVIAGWLNARTLKNKLDYYWQSALSLLPAGAIAFSLMAIFWPWAVMGSDHILIAAKSFSHFSFDMNTMVDGEFVSIGDVPRSYLFNYLSIRLPEIFLLGLLSVALMLIIKTKGLKLANSLPEISVAIALLTPLLFVLFDRPALYNGVRHFTFILPVLAITAGIGLSKAFDMLTSYKKLRLGFIAFCILLTSNTIYTLYALHPYQYLYYNHFAGENFKKAIHHWEGDYWSSSLIDATKLLKNYIDAEQMILPNNRNKVYSVAVCAEAFQGSAYLDKRFNITEDWVTADFYMSSTNMNCDKVLKGKVIGMVERLGTPLAIVKDRRNLTGEDRRPHAAPRD
ncbi:MAG: glycosyltransferase family 39 protein [Methylotenera sp.]|nr:glycosyltransferase family 39 protein [Methylotenera sp.]